MQIVIPMSGRGQRFKDAGYKDIKPLIEVDGIPIIEHVVRMFPGESDFLFICARDHLETTPLRSVLERIAPGAKIVPIDPHKKGPVHAVLMAAEHIKDDEPTIVNYCDFSVGWNYDQFMWEMSTRDPAGCLTAYRGFHPHTLGPNLYAYMRHRENHLLEIREKACFTDDRMKEYASSGTYYFRSGQLLKEYFQKAVTNNMTTNGEFYASMPFNLLVADDLPVYIYELEHFLQWGTPEDLAEYVNWSEAFRHSADWTPQRPAAPGTNLLPMVGSGVRFQREGYLRPKPLVPVAGLAMVERSLNSLPRAEQWVAVCRTEHLSDPDLRPALEGDERCLDIVAVDKLTSGQASTCLLAADDVDMDAPLLIGPCDTAVVYDEDRYAALTEDPTVDCIVWTFRNHPHANRNPRQYGWVETDAAGDVLEIR
ncbi:MAG TPA: NTP transferase domain-containing protein, partial [Gemmataceae bacterium]|nr:NTP transferase domain-containing protein [Gemmataceae bacterium]